MSFTADINEIIEENHNGLLAKYGGWKRIELRYVAEILNGFPFDSKKFSQTRGEPIIRIRDVVRGYTETFFYGEIPDDYWIKMGDILVGMDGDFNMARWKSKPALLNQRVLKLNVASIFFDEKFLFFVLSGYLQAINLNTSSVTVKHLSSKTVQSIPLPLPPLAEQQEIARQLDTLLAQVERTQARLQRIPDILKRFRQSVLAAAVSGKLTETTSSERFQLLGNVGIEIKTGPFGSALHKSDYVTDGIPVVNPMHITEGVICPSVSMSITKEKFNELANWQLQLGDVVVGRRGEMGRAATVTETPMLCGTGSMFLKPGAQVNSKYLEIVLRSPTSINFFNAKSVGTTMVNLNQEIIKNLKVYFPPLAEQTQIVSRVEQLLTYADRIEQQTQAALERVNLLSQSILAKAFRGELTAQWRAENPDLISGDNSAAALLAKIQAERQGTRTNKNKG